jgi:hypothetical protein
VQSNETILKNVQSKSDLQEKMDIINDHIMDNFQKKRIYQNINEFSYQIKDDIKNKDSDYFNDLLKFNIFNKTIKDFLNSMSNTLYSQLTKIFNLKDNNNQLELFCYNIIEKNLFPKIMNFVQFVYESYYYILNKSLYDKIKILKKYVTPKLLGNLNQK